MLCFLTVYSLQENCTRLIRSMVRKEDICKLEIPDSLRKDISREPDLLRDIKILSAKMSIMVQTDPFPSSRSTREQKSDVQGVKVCGSS